jgi:PAS domain S-box-containing protein
VSDPDFRQIIEAAPDGIVISRGGVVLYVNPAAVALLGYHDASELLGRPMSIFLDEDGIGAMRRRLDEARRTGAKLTPYEYPAWRRDGSRVVAEITSMPVEHDGAPAVLAFARDVTERVQVRAQLVHAERLAAIGVLAAGIAHEINNPLTFISLSAEMLARALADHPAAKAAADVLAGTERISRIVSDMRVFARKEEGAVGTVALDAAVKVAQAIVAHELKPRAEVRIDLLAAPPVRGTQTRVEQVFVNLLLNAAHAIPASRTDGEVVIRARATRTDVIVDVQDNGDGIPSELLGRVFEPFFTTKPAGAGTGLGLSITRDIVRGLGGDIGVESELARGTTVRITLPRAAPGATPVAAARPHPTSGSVPRRVLVIDDEPLIVSLVVGLLEGRHDVAGAVDPREGLERLLDDAAYDVVFCDVMMPTLTGVDVYERVARERPGLERRFVFVTGGPSTDRARAFLAAVPNRRLMKPFTPSQLEHCIDEVVADHRPGESAAFDESRGEDCRR